MNAFERKKKVRFPSTNYFKLVNVKKKPFSNFHEGRNRVERAQMAIYEVTYSTKTTFDYKLSFSDIVLVEAEAHEEFTTKVVSLMRKLDLLGNYHVDGIGGNSE